MSEYTDPHLRVPVLPSSLVGDGYDWMAALPSGWHEISGWGLDGWDLGSWPYVIVCSYNNRSDGVFAMATYTEGDIDIRAFDNPDERDAAIDEVAVWHWRHGMAEGPEDLPPEGEPLAEHHRGVFSWNRLDAARKKQVGNR